MQKVIIFRNELNPDGYGDFIECTDCGGLSLAAVGRNACPLCGSSNLSWAHGEHQECDAETLEKLGYMIENR